MLQQTSSHCTRLVNADNLPQLKCFVALSVGAHYTYGHMGPFSQKSHNSANTDIVFLYMQYIFLVCVRVYSLPQRRCVILLLVFMTCLQRCFLR